MRGYGLVLWFRCYYFSQDAGPRRNREPDNKRLKFSLPSIINVYNSNIFRKWKILFVWGFSSHSRIFHSYEDLKGFKMLTYTRPSLAIEQWGFFSVPHLLWHGASVHTCRRSFGSEAFTICYYDLGLSRLGIEHLTFRMRGEHSNRPRPRGGGSERKAVIST